MKKLKHELLLASNELDSTASQSSLNRDDDDYNSDSSHIQNTHIGLIFDSHSMEF